MAGNIYIEFDTKGLDKGIENLTRISRGKSMDGVNRIADMLVGLSQKEVPFKVGTLQNSGHVEYAQNLDNPEAIVGYGGMSAPYAARLHENPQFNFNNGRKGKYLEDPLKNNLNIFKNIYAEIIGGIFK